MLFRSPAFLSRLIRVAGASVLMGGLLFLASLNYPLLSRLLLTKEIAVLIVCGVGAVIYGAALLGLRAVTIAELKGVLRREPGATAVQGLD